jgi:uncharacterized Zn-binding protein involved in type VI secretion
MPKVVRQGDKNNAGGRVIKGNSSFIVDGRPVSVDGSPVSAHRPYEKPHKPNGYPKTDNGTKKFLVQGIPVNVVGDADTCKHFRVEGSPNFIVGK